MKISISAKKKGTQQSPARMNNSASDNESDHGYLAYDNGLKARNIGDFVERIVARQPRRPVRSKRVNLLYMLPALEAKQRQDPDDSWETSMTRLMICNCPEYISGEAISDQSLMISHLKPSPIE